MLYFAYGTNMDPEAMRIRAPGARALGAARLPGWRLTFALALAEGVWHIEPAVHDEVWGVLWDATEADVRALDVYEAVAEGAYIRRTLTVTYDGRSVDAIVYLAVPSGDVSPSKDDVAGVVRGAEENGLPATYVERLRSIKTAE